MQRVNELIDENTRCMVHGKCHLLRRFFNEDEAERICSLAIIPITKLIN
jgi:hypothetical protein